MQRSGSTIWMENPCKLLRKDMIQQHRSSQIHKEAEELRLSAERDGGIRQVFSTQVALNRKALIGALRIMYCLAKEEIPHTTKFNSLKELAIYLGCVYLNELCLGRNAQYTSEQTISELLHCLSSVIEEKILLEMQCSSLMT